MNEQDGDYRQLLADLLDYMEEGGWAPGKRRNHEERQHTNLVTMELMTVCRCGDPWPCRFVKAYDAVAHPVRARELGHPQ